MKTKNIKAYWYLSKFEIYPDVKYYLNLEKKNDTNFIALQIEIPFGTYQILKIKEDKLINDNQ